MRLLTLFASLALFIVLPAIGANAAAQSLDGIYIFDSHASDDITAAIDAATSNMNFIVRSVARSRLKKTNPVYQRIIIAREANDIVVTLDNRKPIRMPANGAVIKWTREDGEKFDLNGDWKESQLVQTYVAEDGKRINEFVVGSDPLTMTLHVTIISGRLDKPMTYTLAYRRANS